MRIKYKISEMEMCVGYLVYKLTELEMAEKNAGLRRDSPS